MRLRNYGMAPCAVAAREIEAPMPAVIEGLQKMDDALRTKRTNIMHAPYCVAKPTFQPLKA